MLSLAIGKSTPPGALILLDFEVFLLGAGTLALAKPEEGALAMFFVLVVLSDIHIAIGVDLASFSFLLVMPVVSLVDSSISIDRDTLHMMLTTFSMLLLVSDLP